MYAAISYLTPIVLLCAVLAWTLVRARSIHYMYVAALLSWWCSYTATRAALWHSILGPERVRIGPDAPYTGTALLAYYIELALRLTWPFAILAACIAMFLRRRPWFIALPWAVAVVALCGLYPDVRRREQAYVEAAIATACWVASVYVVWRGHRKLQIDPPECYTPTWIILGAQLAVILIVQWAGEQESEWSIARAIQSFAYVGLLAYQAVKLWRPAWMR